MQQRGLSAWLTAGPQRWLTDVISIIDCVEGQGETVQGWSLTHRSVSSQKYGGGTQKAEFIH